MVTKHELALRLGAELVGPNDRRAVFDRSHDEREIPIPGLFADARRLLLDLLRDGLHLLWCRVLGRGGLLGGSIRSGHILAQVLECADNDHDPDDGEHQGGRAGDDSPQRHGPVGGFATLGTAATGEAEDQADHTEDAGQPEEQWDQTGDRADDPEDQRRDPETVPCE
jgi:hypothetical protein